jgi:DUF4097 and DUF4098 domain-containing protein YvlB
MSIAAARVLCASFILAAAATGLAQERLREDFEQVVPFNPGGSFRIENRNGDIEIATWGESSVRIEAEKTAKDEEGLENVEIQIQGSGSDVSVETLYHGRRNHGEVSYRILLPEEAQVSVATANGEVIVRGIRGRVDAHSVNGAVTVEDVSGEIDAETTNGSIRATYEKAAEGTHRFSTTNGSIRIYLPSGAGGEIDAETVNGGIDVNFPVTLTRTSRRHLRGTFGNGGSAFQVSTVNGSVKFLTN